MAQLATVIAVRETDDPTVAQIMHLHGTKSRHFATGSDRRGVFGELLRQALEVVDVKGRSRSQTKDWQKRKRKDVVSAPLCHSTPC